MSNYEYSMYCTVYLTTVQLYSILLIVHSCRFSRAIVGANVLECWRRSTLCCLWASRSSYYTRGRTSDCCSPQRLVHSRAPTSSSCWWVLSRVVSIPVYRAMNATHSGGCWRRTRLGDASRLLFCVGLKPSTPPEQRQNKGATHLRNRCLMWQVSRWVRPPGL